MTSVPAMLFRKLVLTALAVATAAAVGYAIRVSFDPNYYFRYSREQSWTYDAGNVAFHCAFMVVEAGFVGLVLFARRPRALWARSMLGSLLFMPWASLSALYVMHQPGYILLHVTWVWALLLVLVLVALGSVARRLWIRYGKVPREAPLHS